MLVKVMVAFAMAFGLIFGGASAANAGQEAYPYWKNQCFGEIKYWSNKKKRFVNKQAKTVSGTLDNWSLRRTKNRSDADIKIVFKTPRRIENISDGGWIGVTYYDYEVVNYAAKDKSFDNAKVITPSKGWGWQTIFTHEFWHSVGLDHVRNRDRVSIMNPYLGDKVVYGGYPDAKDYKLLKTVDKKCNRAGSGPTKPVEEDWTPQEPRTSEEVLDDALGPLPFEDVVVE